MPIAILCSGQGRQNADMFRLTGQAPEASELFTHAASLLDGQDPREIVHSTPIEALHHDRIGQILCTLQALAAAAMLDDVLPPQRIVAGYSVGELAAWSVAGILAPAGTLDLAAKRAAAMDKATTGNDGMLFVRGLARGAIDALCAQFDTEVAIVEPDDAFILAGNKASLDELAVRATAMNAGRVVDVPVEVASHTKRLAAASPEFRKCLSVVDVRRSPPDGARLLSGIDGAAVVDCEEGLDKLAAQISHTVEWAVCLQSCTEAGATAFLELGPASALSDMAAKTYPDIAARSIDDFRTTDGVRAWVARQAAR